MNVVIIDYNVGKTEGRQNVCFAHMDQPFCKLLSQQSIAYFLFH